MKSLGLNLTKLGLGAVWEAGLLPCPWPPLDTHSPLSPSALLPGPPRGLSVHCKFLPSPGTLRSPDALVTSTHAVAFRSVPPVVAGAGARDCQRAVGGRESAPEVGCAPAPSSPTGAATWEPGSDELCQEPVHCARARDRGRGDAGLEPAGCERLVQGQAWSLKAVICQAGSPWGLRAGRELGGVASFLPVLPWLLALQNEARHSLTCLVLV